jgi:hypothetical protein
MNPGKKRITLTKLGFDGSNRLATALHHCSSPMLLATALRQCSWPLLLATALCQCSWPLLPLWPLLFANAPGNCSLPMLPATALCRCSCPLLFADAPGHCFWLLLFTNAPYLELIYYYKIMFGDIILFYYLTFIDFLLIIVRLQMYHMCFTQTMIRRSLSNILVKNNVFYRLIDMLHTSICRL